MSAGRAFARTIFRRLVVAAARPGVGGAGAGFDVSERFVNLRFRVRRGQDGGDRALNPSGWPNRVGDGFEVARETVVHLPDALHGGVRRFQGLHRLLRPRGVALHPRNINSEGTYFTGYVSPVKQRMFFGDRTVLAYDASLILNHAKSLDLARRVQDGVVINGTLQKLPANVAGRHGIPPLASLSYFDLHFGYLLPWIHAGPWGILKNFWKHLLRDYTGQAPALVISKAGRKQMSERAKYLVLTSDMGRPYTDIVKYKGTWVMENWLHWAETFSPVIVHDILQQECPEALEAWMNLRKAFLHYLCSHGWYDHMNADEKEKACCDATVSIREYARFVEEKLGIQYCTINLRLLAVHSYDQEIQTGPIEHTLEFWVERAIQRYKKWVKDRVVNNPDIFLGQGYLLECALNVASAGERDVQKVSSCWACCT